MSTLQIIEIFSSIQGETSWTGLPTLFIRLASCNLRCTWCDTTYSFGRGTRYTITSILESVDHHALQHICVTGGEPLLQQDVFPLMSKLCDEDYQVILETGGSLSIASVDPRVKIILDVKCPGSGMEGRNFWDNIGKLKRSDEVKFVIKDKDDYCYAKGIVEQYALTQRVDQILFSPVFDELDPQELVEWILEDKLAVRLNLQMHKYIWSKEKRGV
ncbi:radical SAM protein [Simkania negevensis]|uniref:7-carboxy-7-deazaguanine synthase n=1 Tax=Simkania negevensis TaxID=83561 RepID=A0ABS3APX1_9BACT|nr:radical SAM protein [Simkania negevensis]